MLCSAACGPVLLSKETSSPREKVKAKGGEENLLAFTNRMYLPYFWSSRHFLVSAIGCTLALALNLRPQPELSNRKVVGQVAG